MRLTSEELRGLYQQETTRRTTLPGCPSADDLMRVAAEDSTPGERDRVIDHLVACSDCAEEFRLIRPMETTFPEGAAVSTAYSARESNTRSETPTPRPGGFLGLFGARIGYALAAALIVVTALLAFWIGSLRRDNSELTARLERQAAEGGRAAELQESLDQTRNQLRLAEQRSEEREAEMAALRKETDQLGKTIGELSQLHVNAFVADIEPSDSVRGGRRPGIRTVVVPRSASLVTLILNLGSRRLLGRYALEIISRDGRTISKGVGLQQSVENTFTIAVSRRLLQSGQYRLKLYALRAGQNELVEEYAVRVGYR